MPDWPQKRQHSRFRVPGATVAYHVTRLMRQPLQETCPVFSLGKGGLGFGSHNRIKPGQKLSLALNIPSELSQVELQAQVIYCIPHPGMNYRYHIGVAFAPFATTQGSNSPEALDLLDRLEETYRPRS
jgi:hypothetical protein